MRGPAPWVALAAATGAVGWALGAAGLPSSFLFGALLVGLAVAIAWPDRLEVPARGFAAAQAVTGVTLGAYLQSSALQAVGGPLPPPPLPSAPPPPLRPGARVPPPPLTPAPPRHP